MADDLNLGMFKTHDIRTKQQNLTEEGKERLYHAVALYYRDVVKTKSVVVSHDTRLYAPEVAEGMTRTLRKAGLDVYLNPLPISTCQFYYNCLRHPESAGIMVTASHNPGEYIGMKLLAPGFSPIASGNGPEGGIDKIKALYVENQRVEEDGKGKLTIINYLDSYVDYSLKLAGIKEGSLKGMHIMLEFLNGSAGTELSLAFQKAGAEIEARDVVPNGFFPIGDPNPIIEKSIAPTRKAMKEGSFDLGFCFDGDGDRMDLMNRDGEQIAPGFNMAVLLPRLMEIYGDSKKDVYADVKAIPVALCEMASSGANVHIIRNGHSFIKEKLQANCNDGYFAAVEESAHYYMNFPIDLDDPEKGYAPIENTLFYALLTARCFKDNPEAYRKAESLQASICRCREWSLHCEAAPEKMPLLLQEIEEAMKKEGALIIHEMDDGSDLDASLIRFNLPSSFDENSSLEGKVWAQVAQRISRSEDALCRWEIVSNNQEECRRLNALVRSFTDNYVEKGWARY